MRLLSYLAILLAIPACAAVAQSAGKSPFGPVPLLGTPPAVAPVDTPLRVPEFSANALRRPGDSQFQLHLEQPYLDPGRVPDGQRLPSFSTIPGGRHILGLVTHVDMARGLNALGPNRQVCYAMRNYQFTQGNPASDATSLKDYSTCQAAAQFQTKAVAVPLVLAPR